MEKESFFVYFDEDGQPLCASEMASQWHQGLCNMILSAKKTSLPA
jgi:hypothetical protein